MNKQLLVEIPKELHLKIKMRAAEMGITLKVYVLRALLERMLHDDQKKQGQ